MRTRARVRARVRHGSLNVDLLPRQTDRRRTRATRWKLLCKYDYIYPAASWQAHILFNEEYCAFLFLSVQSQPFSSTLLPPSRASTLRSFSSLFLLLWLGHELQTTRHAAASQKSRRRDTRVSLACLHRDRADVGNVFRVGSFQDRGSRYDHARTSRPTYVFRDGIHKTRWLGA
mgnify:CR=1 FL=1